MATSMDLKLISERTLHQMANPQLLAYCPSMELLALGTTDQQVILYRLNGQRVYSTPHKDNSLSVDRICWKPNGQLLAIAWSDGIVRLVEAENSKNVHQIETADKDDSSITCLGWVSNFTGKRAHRARIASDNLLWKHTLKIELVDSIDQSPLDLPRDLALIDIESSLPRMSPLPAGGNSEDIFSSRASLDGLFHAFDPTDSDSVDVMVVGTKDGQIHLSIYDSFVVGSFPSPLIGATTDKHKAYMILHASHENYSTHAFLMSSESNTAPGLYFVPMDLRFVSASSEYLSLLASKSTALQNILRYIRQVQVLMSAEWQATQDLPKKFLRNINETLKESNRCDIVQAMYHSVATGHTFPAFREWLVEELAERGHKRWDKSVNSGLENLRRLVHEDMLPALERCGLILSRLTGVVEYQDPNDTMGFSSHQIELVMETLACLNLACTKILTYVIDELDLFAAFSAWIRHEIDRLASDSSSSPPDDVLEKESTIDHTKVLLYIQVAMTQSRLAVFFEEETGEDERYDTPTVEQGVSMLDLLDEQLRKHEEGLQRVAGLARVDYLCTRIGQQATAVFRQIAEAEKRNVLFGQPTLLSSQSNNGPLAMRLFPQDTSHFRAYVAIMSPGRSNTIHVISICMKVENGISSQKTVVEATLLLDDFSVKDFAFLNNGKLLVLYMSKEERPGLLIMPCEVEDAVFSYHRLGALEMDGHTQSINEILNNCRKISFPEGGHFVPDRLEVSEMTRNGSQLDSTRLCILDKSRLHYKVFTISNAATSSILADYDISMS